jgi:hypothetical protein
MNLKESLLCKLSQESMDLDYMWTKLEDIHSKKLTSQ